MRKIVSIILAAMMMTACGGGSASDGTGLTFTMVKAGKTVSISQEQGAPQCQVSLQLAAVKDREQAAAINKAIISQLLNMEDMSDMQQAADSFAAKYTRDYQRNFAQLYREDRNDAAKRAWYEYHYNITTETKGGREGISVYTAIIDYYEGGAHGINQKLIMNFDNKTGKLLTLSDIFVAGFEQNLNSLLLEKLMVKADVDNIDKLHEKGYLYSMDMFAPENFSIDEESITFVYNPYEIAPYDKGMIELTLDYDELKEIWK